MPDILGATNPVPGYDKAAVNRNLPVSPENTQIQNIPDPTRVSRTDGRTERQDSTLQGDGRIRYDSNFQTFLQRLQETPGMSESLSRIFGWDRTEVSSGISAGMAEEMSRVLEMLQMDAAQLLEFLKGQARTGTRFHGALFALLRSAYAKAASDGMRSDILNFLKCYIDYSSTAHLEGSILRNLEDMADAMPASWAEKLREMAARLENGMAAGDRRGNVLLLQRELFPYMSDYVGRTHDMGLPRSLLTMLSLNAVRYENGTEERLLEAFHQLSGYAAFKDQLRGIDGQSLLALLRSSWFDGETGAVRFANSITAAVQRAMRGECSAEMQQAFQSLMGAVLVNESVYMPVNHYLLPLMWNHRALFSELWVDPDAEGDGGRAGSRQRHTMKILFKMDVQPLGLFDIILNSRGNEVDIQVSCPERVVPFSGQIEQSISQILERNGLSPTQVIVRKLERPVTLTEVFPKIFEGKNCVNVKA